MCVSFGPVDLFSIISKIFDSYDICPHNDCLNSIMGLIFRLLSYFQMEFKSVVVNCDNLKLEVFCALVNSMPTFLSLLRDLIERVNKMSGMKIEKIKSCLNNNNLIKNFTLISNASFSQIEKLLTTSVNQHFESVKNTGLEFNIEKFIESYFEVFNPIFKMLHHIYKKRLWNHLFAKFCELYILMMTMKTKHFKTSETQECINRIKNESDLILDVFKNKVSNKVYGENRKKLVFF